MKKQLPAIYGLNNSPLATQLDPWDRQPEEPVDWYQRFVQYRTLGPKRTIREAYRLYKKVVGEKALSAETWNKKATDWKWSVRAEAWDTYIKEQRERKEQEILQQEYAVMSERVEVLNRIAKKLEEHVLDPNINKPSTYIVEQLRGTLADIALETGGRSQKTQQGTNVDVKIVTSWGRGGSATTAWESSTPEPTVVESVIVEKTNE